MSKSEVRYAGFFTRFVASLLDTLIIALPVGGVVYVLSGGNWFDFSGYMNAILLAQQGDITALDHLPKTTFSWEIVFEISVLAITIIFWNKWRGATPGKKIVGIAIVDAKTFKDISNTQALTRSLGYIPSTFLFGLGFFMVIIRSDKRALHDLLADTAVIHIQS